MSRSKSRDLLAFCLGIVLIGALIQGAGALKGDALVFPGVDEILKAFFRLLGTGKTYALIWTTLQHLIVIMAVSTVLGVGLGVAMGLLPFLRKLLQPLMILLRSLPMVLLIVITMVAADYALVMILLVLVVSEGPVLIGKAFARFRRT